MAKPAPSVPRVGTPEGAPLRPSSGAAERVSRDETDAYAGLGEVPPRVKEMGNKQRRHYEMLVDGAIVAFGTSGFERASVQEIIEEAGVARQCFYRNFASREACFITAYEHVLGRLATAVEGALDGVEEWPDRVIAMGDAMVGVYAPEPHLVRMMLIETAAAGPWAARHHRKRLELFTSILDEGREYAGDPGGLLPDVATMAIGAANAILVQEVRARKPRDLTVLAPEIQFALLMPYLGPLEARKKVSNRSL